MKKAHFWLLDGKEIILKGNSYEELLMEIDNFFDIFKESITYYLGYSDESVFQECIDNEVNIESGDEI